MQAQQTEEQHVASVSAQTSAAAAESARTKNHQVSRSQQRRFAKQMRKQDRLQMKKQQQLHLFLDQDAVRMLNWITKALDVDPRDFIRSVIPIHYREIRKMQEQALAKLEAESKQDALEELGVDPESAAEAVAPTAEAPGA